MDQAGTLNGTNGDSLRAARTPERDELTQQLTGGRGFLLPHFRTFSSMYNMASRIYSYRWDEAYRAGRENANAMLRDAYFRSLLQERLKPLRRWKVDIEAISHDPNAGTDPEAEQIRQLLLGAYNQTAKAGRQRYYLGMAIWYGRYGSQVRWERTNINGHSLWCTPEHAPVNGDKIQCDWAGHYGIMIQPQVKNDYPDVRIADAGAPVLMLSRQDIRDRFIIHTYDLEDADYWEADKAGRVAGIGLRDYCYWGWWLRNELIGWLMDFMEKVGSLGIMLFFYQEGSAEGKRRAEESARAVGNGNALAVPVPKNDPRSGGVELIPANTSGSQFLTEMISDWFERHIERLIIGQSMSGGKDSGDGLGGTGRAEFAKDTKFQLLASDAEDLAETLTTDWLIPCQRINGLGFGKHEFKFVLRVPDPEAKDKLAAVQTATSFGVEFEEDEVRDLTGLQKPRPGVKTIGGQQQGGMPGMGGPGMPPGGDPNDPQGAGGPQQMPPDSAQSGINSADSVNSGLQGAGGPQASGQGNAPPELVAAMLELAYQGDHDGVRELAEFGSDPEAVVGLMDDEPEPQRYSGGRRLVHYNVTDQLGHEHGGDGKFVSKGGVSESSGDGGAGASPAGRPQAGKQAQAQAPAGTGAERFDQALKTFGLNSFVKHGGPSRDEWISVMDHPEKGHQRFEKLQALHNQDSEEDDEPYQKREKEDEKRYAKREKEDEKREKAREKEDSEIEKKREKEDKELEKKKSAHEKIGETREKVREKEDKDLEKRREKEDGETSKTRDKEDSELKRKRSQEDKDLAARFEEEDTQVKSLMERVYTVIVQDLSPEERAAALELIRKDADGLLRSYDLGEQNVDIESLDDEISSARDDLKTNMSDDRSTEDEQIEDRRVAEDGERESARSQEDEELATQRDKEDEEYSATEQEIEEQETDLEQAREEEDTVLISNREDEDYELGQARENEDHEIEEARNKEDEPVLAARAKRDRELLERWKAEDDGTANEGGSDGGLLELFSLVSYQWTAAQTKSGKVKAVWQGEGQRRPLYGKQAEAALQRKDRGEADPAPGTPSRTKQMLVDRKAQAEPARADARQRWAEAIAKGVPHEQLGQLAEHLQTLTRDEIREMARGLEKRVGGLKRDLVQRLIDHVRPQETQQSTPGGEPVATAPGDSQQQPEPSASPQPAGGPQVAKPVDKPAFLHKEFTTPGGAKIKTVHLDDGSLGFEANGKKLPISDPKPLDPKANAESIKRLQAAGKSTDDYVIMGSTLLPKAIADELLGMHRQHTQK